MMVEPDKTAEMQARRRRRSIALALVLVAFAAIVYALTIVKLGPGVFQRPM